MYSCAVHGPSNLLSSGAKVASRLKQTVQAAEGGQSLDIAGCERLKIPGFLEAGVVGILRDTNTAQLLF